MSSSTKCPVCASDACVGRFDPLLCRQRPCARCGKARCPGIFNILTCLHEIDGKTAMVEAETFLRERYEPKPAPLLDIPREAFDVVRRIADQDYVTGRVEPWMPEADRRPKAKGGKPRVGLAEDRTNKVYLGSAKHGECTFCCKAGGPITAATWRWAGPGGRNTISSLCDRHMMEMVDLPMEVPNFDDPAQAQAWLDQLTERIGA